MAERLLPRDLQFQWMAPARTAPGPGAEEAETAPEEGKVEEKVVVVEEEEEEPVPGDGLVLDLRLDARLALLLEQLVSADRPFFRKLGVRRCERRSRKDEVAVVAALEASGKRAAGGYASSDSSDSESDGSLDASLPGGERSASQASNQPPVLLPHPNELGRERRANAEYRAPQPKTQRAAGTRSRSSHPRMRMYATAAGHSSGGARGSTLVPTTPMENPSRGHRFDVTANWKPEGGFNARVRIIRGAPSNPFAGSGPGGGGGGGAGGGGALGAAVLPIEVGAGRGNAVLRSSQSLVDLRPERPQAAEDAARAGSNALHTGGLVLPALATHNPAGGGGGGDGGRSGPTTSSTLAGPGGPSSHWTSSTRGTHSVRLRQGGQALKGLPMCATGAPLAKSQSLSAMPPRAAGAIVERVSPPPLSVPPTSPVTLGSRAPWQ